MLTKRDRKIKRGKIEIEHMHMKRPREREGQRDHSNAKDRGGEG